MKNKEIYERVYARMDKILPTEEEFCPITDYYFWNSQFQTVVDSLLGKNDSDADIYMNDPYTNVVRKNASELILMSFKIRFDALRVNVFMNDNSPELEEFCKDVSLHVLNEIREKSLARIVHIVFFNDTLESRREETMSGSPSKEHLETVEQIMKDN